MGISIRRSLQIILLSAAWFHASSALAEGEGVPPDPETLAQTNMLVDGGFHDDLMGCDCAWQMERSAGVDGSEPGAMFLNGGLPGAISAIHQSLNGLTPGQIYTIALQWRAVGREAAHSTVAQTGLSLELDGAQLHQLVPAGRPLEWNTHEVQFTAGAPRARLTLRSLGQSTESGVLLNYVSVQPLEEGLAQTGNDIVLTTPVIGDPIELTENGLVIPPLPGPVFADGTQEPERVAQQMPASTRLMAYSIGDEVRGQTDTQDYFFDVDEDGRGKIILGRGLNFDVVGVDEVVTGDDFDAFAAAARAMSGVDLKSEDVVMLRAANGAAEGAFLSVFDDHSEFSPQFSPDNVFVVRPPLETEATAGFVSFEAAFLPGEFIRHQGFFLKLDPVTADSPTLDKRDATFQLVEVSSPADQASCSPATPATDRGRLFCEGVLSTNGVTGSGASWSEDEMFRMCAGILNPQTVFDRLACVRAAYASNPNVTEAISACVGNAETTCAEQPETPEQTAQAAEPQQPAVQADSFAALPECVKLLTDGNTLDWGGGKQWNEGNAQRLCAGVNSAEDIVSRFSCFEEDLAATSDWEASINNCTGNAQAANGEQPAPQQPAQVTEPQQPAVQPDSFAAFPECVKLLTEGNTLDWGGGTVWQPQNAELLCAGVTSPEDIVSRFSCFDEVRTGGADWQSAIASCVGETNAASGAQPAPQPEAREQTAQAPAPEQSSDPASRPSQALLECIRILRGSTGPTWNPGEALCAGVTSIDDSIERFECFDAERAGGKETQAAVSFCVGGENAAADAQTKTAAASLPMDKLGEDGGVFYGEVGGIPVAIGSDQIGIEYDPKAVALKIIKGDGLSSTVQIVFSAPVSAVEIDLGDYDVSDGTNPDVAGRSAEYLSNFSIFPSAMNGSLMVVDGGEVHSKDNDGAGTLIWRDLQGVQTISFVHHRGVPGLGVFLKGVRVTP